MFKRNFRVLGVLSVTALLWACGGEPVEEPSAQQQAAKMKGPSIVELTLQVNGSGPYAGTFDTLVAALLAADPAVLGTLSGKGQFTVFAPTDDAFEALGLDSSTIGTLDQGFLTDVLLYHVARGERYAGDVLDSERIRMLYKGFTFPSASPSPQLTDNLGRSANIILTDIPAANGVIHVIDAVVLPYAP